MLLAHACTASFHYDRFGSELTKAKQFAFASQLSWFRTYKRKVVCVCLTVLMLTLCPLRQGARATGRFSGQPLFLTSFYSLHFCITLDKFISACKIYLLPATCYLLPATYLSFILFLSSFGYPTKNLSQKYYFLRMMDMQC